MFTRIVFLTLLCLLAPTALAQVAPVEKGTSADLRGATSVFIDTGASVELRDAIVADLRRELPQLAIVDRAADAMLIVQFTTSIGPDNPYLDLNRADRSGLSHRTNTDRQPPPPGSKIEDRLTMKPQPEIVEARKTARRPVDAFANQVSQSRPNRYAIGSVFTTSGTNRLVEPVSFKRRIGAKADDAVHAFTRKFVKVYRKANAASS